MVAKIIDGRAIAREIRVDLRRRTESMKDTSGVVPGLAVILVGKDAPSALYVKNKMEACDSVGVQSFQHFFSNSVNTDTLVELIERLNGDERVHGILVQLPLPQHIDMRCVLESISVEKDVDGFHLYNVGGLVVGHTVFSPCTPYGVTKLLDAERIKVAGQNVVVVGASNIVGKPMALMLMQREATVSICHARTRELAEFTKLADILVVAAGKPCLIVPEMIKEGAAVVDVGINRLADGSITGDVDFEGVRRKASYLTPVPGGVGPMTVTMLLENTIAAAERVGLKSGLRKRSGSVASQK